MSKRPLAVTIIALVYVLMGVAGLAYHLAAFKAEHPFQYDNVWIELIFVIAIVSGVYMLRGHNWARWVALAWIAFHVVVSAFHTLPEFAIHSLFCAVLAYFLFRPATARYFRTAGK